ncbi:hypothetical protein [Nocardia aurantiaca]|uniref:Type II toxin-antitoxin system PemK/MazF family toxin n=1 Tax=Nocardia aurantiaca TaxID=2675850 RepID=A0A6I3L2E5_9NOCA|nr:hypothetical protein [Nocardia aurantiaca]MTE14785.1 hypothetical protein [Nocardia aurantiaca]
MRRGELWVYHPHGNTRTRTIILISSDGINESPRPWLIAAEVEAEDPQDILAVPIPGHGWVHAGNLGRIYRGWLDERVAAVDSETAERIDTALRAAMDL